MLGSNGVSRSNVGMLSILHLKVPTRRNSLENTAERIGEARMLAASPYCRKGVRLNCIFTVAGLSPNDLKNTFFDGYAKSSCTPFAGSYLAILPF